MTGFLFAAALNSIFAALLLLVGGDWHFNAFLTVIMIQLAQVSK